MNHHGLTSLLLAVIFSGALATSADAQEKPISIDDYRKHALRRDGDIARGKALFSDARAKCSQCHSVDGRASLVGPDLYAAGDKHSRGELIESVLQPSSRIMVGFSTTIVELKNGETVEGILKEILGEELVLANAANERLRVAMRDIKAQRTGAVSLMPEGLQAGLSRDEFADLITYLEHLKQPDSRRANEAGTPREIKTVARPATLTPIHGPDIRFKKPLWFAEHPVINGTFIVAEQTNASLWLLEGKNDRMTRQLFVNVLDEIFIAENEGLLGVAFHPRFKENRRYYLMHEFKEAKQRAMIIAERTANPDLRSDPGGPSRRIMRIDVGTEIHHGGGIEFGPDGHLYIGLGDTGPQGDPLGHAQNLHNLFGKLLRIDVNRSEGGRNYAIPRDNPFVDHPDPKVRREIFVYGLRQPWRYSWHPETGDLWMADVGQNRFEEVGIVRAGENHGWNIFEGFELYSTKYRRDGERYVPPIVSFTRRHGASVTAGYIYRGEQAPSFKGAYICGDYESRRIWAFTQKNGMLEKIREIGRSPSRIVAFGEDRSGELYVIGYDKGIIYKLDLSQTKFE